MLSQFYLHHVSRINVFHGWVCGIAHALRFCEANAVCVCRAMHCAALRCSALLLEDFPKIVKQRASELLTALWELFTNQTGFETEAVMNEDKSVYVSDDGDVLQTI